MKTLKELAKEVYNARSLPGVLADLHIEIASIYDNMSEEWVDHLLKDESWAEWRKNNPKKVKVLTNNSL